ncbi:MAG: HD domain-containing protein [Patescibacteria group bacterium]
MDYYSDKDRFLLEKAITFLVTEVNHYCRNKKPVILHSIRVGLTCAEYRRSIATVIAGVLHDVVEDTKCTHAKITKQFGRRVGRLVGVLTMDYSHPDYQVRWRQSVQRIRNSGSEAILIKSVDIIDNMPYYSHWVTDQAGRRILTWKWNFFRQSFARELKRLHLYAVYSKHLRSVKK